MKIAAGVLAVRCEVMLAEIIGVTLAVCVYSYVVWRSNPNQYTCTLSAFRDVMLHGIDRGHYAHWKRSH